MLLSTVRARPLIKPLSRENAPISPQITDWFETLPTDFCRIQDRREEHLVSSDKAIVAARKLLEKAIRDVQEGRDPAHVAWEPSQNHYPHLLVISDMIPNTSDWKDYTKGLELEARAKM